VPRTDPCTLENRLLDPATDLRLTVVAIWFSCNMSGAIIGSSMAYGLYQADLRHALPLAGWKLVFVILGSITAGVGVLFLVLVPDTVDKARFLTPEERVLALERIRANQQGVIVSQFKPEQVKEALLDPFVRHIGKQNFDNGSSSGRPGYTHPSPSSPASPTEELQSELAAGAAHKYRTSTVNSDSSR
jgi:MFS family permease